MITTDTRMWLRLHHHYSKGILIIEGGLMNQPNKYLEAMEIIG